MKLLSLKLENFQGIKSLEITSDGSDIEVRGDNATGKTTIGNAITWLLYNKPLDGGSNFSPKTLSRDGGDIHNLVHGVEAIFTDAGQQLTIKKEFKELWKKKRGTPKSTFTGHTTEYYLNDIPVNAGEYGRRIEQICNPEMAKVLTNPFYFPVEMKWTDRRELLLSVCGDITDEQVIASSEELAPLGAIINGENGQKIAVDDYLKISKSSMTKINEDLKSIPSRIDEATKAKPDVSDIYPKVFQNEVNEYEVDIASLEKQKASLESGQVDTRLLDQKNELNRRYSDEYAKYSQLQQKEKSQQVEALTKSAFLVKTAEEYLNLNQANIQKLKQMIEQKQVRKQQLLERYKDVTARVWDGSTECPTCGQTLPEEKIQETIAKFNVTKSSEREAISAEATATCSKEIIKKLTDELNDRELVEMPKAVKELAQFKKDHQVALDLVVDDIPFDQTDAGKSIKANLAAINEKINEPNKEIGGEVVKIDATVRDLKEKITGLKRRLLDYEVAERQELRIAELKLQEESLATEYEKLEANVFLCEQFIKAKVSMLTESINNRFKNVRFKLFDDQINGGLKECCEVLVSCAEGLIPFGTANNAGKINAGIEIIDALSNHWSVELPLIVDNAESVTQLLETELQVIKLIVDEKFKELQINGGKEEWQKTA